MPPAGTGADSPSEVCREGRGDRRGDGVQSSSSDVITAYLSFPCGARPPCKRFPYNISPRLTLVRLLVFPKKMTKIVKK